MNCRTAKLYLRVARQHRYILDFPLLARFRRKVNR